MPIIKLKPLDDEEEEGRLEELDLIEEEPPKIPTLPPLAPIAKTLLDAASAWVARVDPLLRHAVRMSDPLDAWLWQNGPERVFLVYAVELKRPNIEGTK